MPRVHGQAQNLTPNPMDGVVGGCDQCGEYRIAGGAVHDFMRLQADARVAALETAKGAARSRLAHDQCGRCQRLTLTPSSGEHGRLCACCPDEESTTMYAPLSVCHGRSCPDHPAIGTPCRLPNDGSRTSPRMTATKRGEPPQEYMPSRRLRT